MARTSSGEGSGGIRDLFDGAIETVNAPEPVPGAPRGRRMRRDRLPDLRSMLSAQRVAGVALIAAAAVLVFLPLPSTGCASALASYVARDQATPTDGGEPEATSDLIAAQSRLDQANSEVAAVDSLDADAAAKDDAASKAQDAADAAQSEADSASFDAQYSDSTSSAELDLQMAQDAVDSAKSSLQDAQDMLATDQQQGWDTTYDAQSVADAKDALATAQSDLTQKQSALATAQGAAADVQSSAQSKAAKAKKLQGDADKLKAAAESAQAEAASRRQDAEAARSAAQSAVDAAEASHTVAVNIWTAAHLAHVGQVRAVNAVRADCRATATRSSGAAGALLLTGLLLLVPLRAPNLHRPRLPARLRRR